MTSLKIYLMNINSLLRIVTVCIITACIICVLSVTVHASGVPSITAEVVSAKPHDTVDVSIDLSNNPGMVSATLSVSFDKNALSLTKVTDGGLLGVQSHKPEFTSPYTLVWVNDTATKNFTANGTIATLTFKVNSTAAYDRTYPIFISYDYENYDIFDKDLKKIKLQTINGAVKVTKNDSFILGDANTDSKVTVEDAVCIQRIIAQLLSRDQIDIVAADVDEDGYISIIDVTCIQRYLSKKSILYPIGDKIE